MGEFLGSAWWLLVSIGVLVTFHEFGHFWVARRCGVKVLRFSVGFGKPIWSRIGRDGTEYAIGAIPLGGYVKMLGEHSLEAGDIEREPTAAELAQSHERQSVWKRIAIAAAGPIANLVLCVALLWAMFVIGLADWSATVGHTQGLAAQAGLQRGDRITRIDGRDTVTWTDAAMALTMAAMDHKDVQVDVKTSSGSLRNYSLPLSKLPAGFDQENVIELSGLDWLFKVPPNVIKEVNPGPAQGILQAGDTVLAIDGQPVHDWIDVANATSALAKRGQDGMVEVERNGERLAFPMRPASLIAPDGTRYTGLGIGTDKELPAQDAVQRLGPLAAVPAAFRETGRMAADSLGIIKRMLTGQASAKNVSGPITIARYANASAQLGPARFLNFLALLSLSLAIINLLPIPVLDGGHLLYYLIELAKGSPLSERAMVASQYLGLVVLAGLMGLAFYNDFLGLAR